MEEAWGARVVRDWVTRSLSRGGMKGGKPQPDQEGEGQTCVHILHYPSTLGSLEVCLSQIILLQFIVFNRNVINIISRKLF